MESRIFNFDITENTPFALGKRFGDISELIKFFASGVLGFLLDGGWSGRMYTGIVRDRIKLWVGPFG